MKTARIIAFLFALATLAACGTDDPARDANNGMTNNGTTPTNNGTTPTNNGTTPTNNGTTPTNNGTTPTNNGTTPTNNGTTPDMGMADMGAEDMGTLDMGGMSVKDGDTCESAIDVTPGGTWADQDTSVWTDDYNSPIGATNCPSGRVTGKDLVYSVNPTVETSYTVTVTPTSRSFDPMIYVRADCAQDACVTGTVLNGPGTPESVTFTVGAGATNFIIVDGEVVSSGSYTLEVTATPT